MRTLSLWLPPLAWMAAIFLVSGQSKPPDVPALVADQGGHVLAYGLLALLFVRAFAGGRWSGLTRSAAWRAWAAAAAYGATDELHQALVPGRFATWSDLAADAFGAGLALVLLLAFDRWRRRRVRDRAV